MVLAGNDKSLDNTMTDELSKREQLSALVDGELDSAEWSDAYAAATDADGRSTWELYQLVGDVLRSPDLAQRRNPAVLAAVREHMAAEPLVLRPAHPGPAVVSVGLPQDAANASVFRWKMAAGFASLAAVAAIGWTSLAALQDGASSAQMAVAPAAEAPVVAVAEADGQQVMLRDPRLDELLAAHKQFGSTSALQMPAGYLRNATFDTPGR